MKKIISVAVMLILVFSLFACASNTKNNNSGASNAAKSSSATSNNKIESQGKETVENEPNASNNKMDSKENETTKSETKEPEVKSKNISFNELISLDFVEITIEGAASADEIRPDNPKRVYSYKSDKDDETYVYLYGTIKNVSGEKFEFADHMYAKMTFDDKYNFNASITADEGGDFSYIYAYLDPLKSEKFYIIASIPDELAEQFNEVEVKFGFREGFDYKYNIQENECDYLYSVNLTR